MKENKSFQIKFRLTATMKEQIENYCAANALTASEMIRLAIQEYFQKRGN